MTEDERLRKIEIESMQELFGKMAQQIRQCADFIIHYSEMKSFCESNSLCRRSADSQCRFFAHCTGKKLGKNIMDVRKETDAMIKDYDDVLDTLMQRFRDRALNSTLLHVRDIGGR
jgi:hypothetical protein